MRIAIHKTVALQVFAILALGLEACTGPADPVSKLLPKSGVSSPPEWRPGDRWVYAWVSGAEKGTKTVEVTAVKEVQGVRYYVVKNAEADHYWTLDLHWAGSARDSKVQARMVPPEPWFLWPLTVGREWTHHGVFEQLSGRRESTDVFRVVEESTVDVPAGRFRGLKVMRESDSRDSDQYWYVPEVRSYVKWVGRRGEVQFEEDLVEYQAAPRALPKGESR